jgi:hypothetical protein
MAISIRRVQADQRRQARVHAGMPTHTAQAAASRRSCARRLDRIIGIVPLATDRAQIAWHACRPTPDVSPGGGNVRRVSGLPIERIRSGTAGIPAVAQGAAMRVWVVGTGLT